jgi:excisionase family DNA binding protein
METQTQRRELAPRYAYSVTEVAVMLGISAGTAYAAVHKGEIRATRILGRYIVPESELNRLLQRPQRDSDTNRER